MRLYLKSKNEPPIKLDDEYLDEFWHVESYFAISEQQAEKSNLLECIHPQLPNYLSTWSALQKLPKDLYDEVTKIDIHLHYKIHKSKLDDFIAYLYPNGTDYPYKDILDIIVGDYFYVYAFAD
ncbi:hypothetical protein OFO12_06975 [Campylobacter sp. JMF_04 NA10]|uniref:hypothetical protein n=1 Tax=Campylobacter sp. JMF_04 NA10 TaxID=2983824 RepID=UPI0022E9A33F|nr:hypothetical protein [Campylobacter sp. JMF_04 NA10]MDA3077098.1 hypothetical protein [Campylobacter sp. JMF_04 NA10]